MFRKASSTLRFPHSPSTSFKPLIKGLLFGIYFGIKRKNVIRLFSPQIAIQFHLPFIFILYQIPKYIQVYFGLQSVLWTSIYAFK